MDKHPKPSVSQILLRMFYALTSSDYDYRKGIKKVIYPFSEPVSITVFFNYSYLFSRATTL